MRFRFVFRSILSDRSLFSAFKLAAVWLLGLLLGYYIGFQVAFDFKPYFLMACSKRIGFLSVSLTLLLPVLLTFCLAYFYPGDSVLIVAFFRAMVFSAAVFSCCYCWRNAGWLVSRLLLFSGFSSIPILIWVWYRVLCGKFYKKEAITALFMLLIVGVSEYCFISPFICSLL